MSLLRMTALMAGFIVGLFSAPDRAAPLLRSARAPSKIQALDARRADPDFEAEPAQ